MTNAHIGSDTSVFDFDAVIWDPARSFERYWSAGYGDTFNGLPSLGEDESAHIKSDAHRRRVEFAEFLDSGRTLVVIMCAPTRSYVHTGKFETSGSGKSQVRTHLVDHFDLLDSALPIKVESTMARGDRIEVLGETPVAKLIRQHADSLEYAAILGLLDDADVVARVQKTDKSVAAIVKNSGGGQLVLMPRAKFAPIAPDSEDSSDWDPRDYEDHDLEYDDAAFEYQNALLAALELMTEALEVSRPAWASDYATTPQRLLRDKVAKQGALVERARKRLSKLQTEVESAQALDQLYLATGRQLELRVRDVLSMLGGVVTEPPSGRADWRVELDGTHVVVEIKGLAGSAAEKNAAQLEKWVAEEIERSERAPKGLLVVNTWRETPLAERTKPDFPAQMLPYATARGHCLMTGLELFLIACEVQADPRRASHWRNEILRTVGRVSGVPDWRGVIHQSTPVVHAG